jgi:hypothetical protein
VDEHLAAVDHLVHQRVAQRAPPRRVPDLRDQLFERLGGPGPAQLLTAADQRRDHHAQHRVRPPLAHHQVGGEVAGGPPLAQRGCVRPGGEQQVGELAAVPPGKVRHGWMVGDEPARCVGGHNHNGVNEPDQFGRMDGKAGRAGGHLRQDGDT